MSIKRANENLMSLELFGLSECYCSEFLSIFSKQILGNINRQDVKLSEYKVDGQNTI